MLRKILILAAVLVVVGLAVFVVLQNEVIAPDVHNEPSLSPTPKLNVTVESPRPNDKVTNPIIVKGQARVFENTFSYALKDTNGNKLYENFAMTDAPDAGIFGNYTVKIPVPATAPKNLVVEVFEYSAKDGSVINLVRVPVTLATQETSKIKVYLGYRGDHEQDCGDVMPSERIIYKTQEVAFLALSELLSGLTDKETSDGFFITSIPKGVRINSIRIQNGTAYADFNEALESGVAGSCKVQAIRAQITDTLKQFSSVKDVVISINGRTQDILQP